MSSIGCPLSHVPASRLLVAVSPAGMTLQSRLVTPRCAMYRRISMQSVTAACRGCRLFLPPHTLNAWRTDYRYAHTTCPAWCAVEVNSRRLHEKSLQVRQATKILNDEKAKSVPSLSGAVPTLFDPTPSTSSQMKKSPMQVSHYD